MVIRISIITNNEQNCPPVLMANDDFVHSDMDQNSLMNIHQSNRWKSWDSHHHTADAEARASGLVVLSFGHLFVASHCLFQQI